MKIKFVLMSLSLVIFLGSCSKSELCPEHEKELICGTQAFLGEWEFVGYDFEIDEGACLSTLEVAIDSEDDILIQKVDEDERGDIKIGASKYSVRNLNGCKAGEIHPTIASIILTNSEMTLVNPNHLNVCNRVLFGTYHKIYRRKQ